MFQVTLFDDLKIKWVVNKVNDTCNMVVIFPVLDYRVDRSLSHVSGIALSFLVVLDSTT